MDKSHSHFGRSTAGALRARLATCLRKTEVMGRGIYWSYTPHENIAAAKARAKAALNEKNPRLTALERAFYNAMKKQDAS